MSFDKKKTFTSTVCNQKIGKSTIKQDDFCISTMCITCMRRIFPNVLLLLNHVVIVVKLCCVEGLMEDICKSNKHSR